MKGKGGFIIGLVCTVLSAGVGLADLIIKRKKGIKLDKQDKSDIAKQIVAELRTEMQN